MPNDPQHVQAVFLAIVELPADDRAAQIERECNGDKDLRHRVDALLKAHDDPDSLLDSPPPGIDFPDIRVISEQPGDAIDAYRLLEQLGEGGFGVVFLAEQVRPVQRQVALKIIKPGMDTRQVIARFEVERQALAMMDHANIAKVFDAGATATGRPYFVMELVRGTPLTDYCDENKLTTHERLNLFISICRAVQHAHQKGIIHRDIKPTNILVAKQGDRAEPKIIDFGVAKAVSQRLIEHTLETAGVQMVGTPLYMSPEQAEPNPLGIDTRSDIYSLGVLLYELLTGTTPFDSARLQAASYDEIRRIIGEKEPPRPSARLGTLPPDVATTVAEKHHTDARRLIQSIRGDLDWIVMKCLEKDRNRRYETVNGLARDIERYLLDEPVSACPPSRGYRFRKFARRNKSMLLAATAGLIALLLLVASLAISNRLIAAARERADEQRQIAQEKALEEQRATKQARAEAAKSNAVVTLLQEMLAAAHPDSAGGKNFTVRKLLDQFSEGLEGQLQDQPQVEATLRQIIGSVYTRLRIVDKAEPHLRRSLLLNQQVFGADHVKYADSLRYLGWNHLEKDRTSVEAETFAREALAIYRKHNDPDRMLQAQWLLVLSLDGQSKVVDAEAIAMDALAVARENKLQDNAVVPNLLHQLAWIKIRQGEYETAEQLARESVEKHRRVHGETHPETAFGWHYLGAAQSWQGKFAEAEVCLRKSLDIFRRSFPEDHDFIRPAVEDLKSVLQAQGKFEELIGECRATIRLRPDDAAAHNRLAWVLSTCPQTRLRDSKEALALASKAVKLAQNASYYNTLGIAQYRAGNWPGAVEALNKSMKGRGGGDSNDWFFLAMAEWQLGNYDAARNWHKKAVDWMQKKQPRNDELARFRDEAEQLGLTKTDSSATD